MGAIEAYPGSVCGYAMGASIKSLERAAFVGACLKLRRLLYRKYAQFRDGDLICKYYLLYLFIGNSADVKCDNMKNYVLGFAFSRDKNDMILISKLKPQWQAGKLNGVGGKVEPEDNSPLDAMYREFKEETGVECSREGNNAWQHFGSMIFINDITGTPSTIYLFKMFSNVIYQCKTIETEDIVKVAVDTALTKLPIMHNLPILIRIALSNEFNYVELSDTNEWSIKDTLTNPDFEDRNT